MDDKGNPTITDDGLVDVSNPNDTFSPPEDEPAPEDWYMADLHKAIGGLEIAIPYGCAKELDEYIARLTKILGKVGKPF